MKRYFVWYWYGTHTCAKLRYADKGDPIPQGWERITRREAERWAASARQTARYNWKDDRGDTEIKPFTAADWETTKRRFQQ